MGNKEVDQVEEVIHEDLNAPGHLGFCQLHFEKGKQYPLRRTKLEDFNGETVWEKDICQKCIEKTQKQVYNQGGRLYI